jgi:hypothetical protein
VTHRAEELRLRAIRVLRDLARRALSNPGTGAHDGLRAPDPQGEDEGALVLVE